MSDKVRILFLAANPRNSSKLRLDEEIREVLTRIRAAEFRDTFELVSHWAVRPLDLLQTFNEVRPHIVHFSGHGSGEAGLVLEDNAGNAKAVSEASLVALFQTAKDNIRLVLLNACNSEVQARAVSQHIDCTVGMNTSIGDNAAIVFASSFYGALAFGRSVGQAFEQGRTALLLEGIPEQNTPVLLPRPGVDVLRVSFMNRKPVPPLLPAVAVEIIRSAVNSNSPVNFVRYEGGLAVLAGAKQFDCKSDPEQAALLEHAVTMLVQVGWLKQTDDELMHVTHAGHEAARQLSGRPDQTFEEIAKQMPELITEMRKDLHTEEGKFVREFFVLERSHCLGGSEKPRFVYYEDDHPNLRGKLDILENHRYVIDVTQKNVPIYRMTEEFIRQIQLSA